MATTNAMRREVLQCFKSLHRTSQKVFKEDTFALGEGRTKINSEFKKCKHVSEISAIAELVQYSRAVEQELKSTVIQAREIAPGRYEARIGPDTIKLDNIPYKEIN